MLQPTEKENNLVNETIEMGPRHSHTKRKLLPKSCWNVLDTVKMWEIA